MEVLTKGKRRPPSALRLARYISTKMFRNYTTPADSEDAVFDASTAPTTPDGSLTFSPVLQALKLKDALEDAVSGKVNTWGGDASLDSTLGSSAVDGVKNICCIGAGYVGMQHFNEIILALRR